MSLKTRLSQTACLSVSVLLLGLMGCENGNLFGKLHDSGDSRDVNVLASDAQIALEHKDFATALALYEKILAQDPDNSTALNGAAIAAVAAAGLNFGQILANIANQSAAPSINGISDLIAAARSGYSTQAASDSILAGVDLAAIDGVIDLAICRLTRIVSGLGDGVINRDDEAVILDLACLRLIRAVLRPIRADFFDLQNISGNYKLVAKTDFNTFCGNAANDSLLIATANDLVAGYVLFNRAATLLNSPSDSIVGRLRTEMDEVIVESLDGDLTDDLPVACVTKINAAGITSSNFRSNTEAFAPLSGC